MFTKGLVTRLLTTVSNRTLMTTKRFASTNVVNHNNTQIMLDRAALLYTPKQPATISQYMSSLRPFTAPAPPKPTLTTPTPVIESFEMTSVLRKRRLKMNKHKHKKLRKRTRALRKKLGK